MNQFAELSRIFGGLTCKVYSPYGKYTLAFFPDGIEVYEIDPQGRVRRLSHEEVNRIFDEHEHQVLITSFVNGAVFIKKGRIHEIPELNPYRVVSACMFGEYTLVVTYSNIFLFKGTAMILTKNPREIENILVPRVDRWEVSYVSYQFRIVSRETGVTLWTYKIWEYTPEMKSIVEEAFDRNHVPVDCLRVVEAMLA